MYILDKIKDNLAEEINKALGQNIVQASDFVYPPDKKMGDLGLACFKNGIKPGGIDVDILKNKFIAEVKWAGPYLNFILKNDVLAEEIIKSITKEKNKYGNNKTGGNEKNIVEYATPNTHKAFHIGHLRNIITGESITRILGKNGHKVVRTNYQGDVGLHIAKCLWGILRKDREYEKVKLDSKRFVKEKDIKNKAEFLGMCYAFGSKNYEENEGAKKEIVELNKKIYTGDKSIKKIYKETRKWSLDYFDLIYKRLGTKFDKLYFESDVFERGKKIAESGLADGIFKKSDGAIIFEGEKYGLHNRVFVNSEGNPTYEAKDLALAELQIKNHKPKKIIHIVGPEQSEYFKVIFKAMEMVLPQTVGKEVHISYGWVRLKDGKMSSRLGNVVLGEWLLDEVKKNIDEIVAKSDVVEDKNILAEKIAQAAVKYSILKNGVKKDIAFDVKESINLSGDSGPYLQYTYARIQSIIRKAGKLPNIKNIISSNLTTPEEKNLIISLAKYPAAVQSAGSNYDPSEVAKYLFDLAKEFNDYYHKEQILKASDEIRAPRLVLIKSVAQVLENGFYLLGIDKVEKM